MSQFRSSDVSPARSPACRRLLTTLMSNVAVLAAISTPLYAQESASGMPTITVNTFDERHLISPYIYGGNFPKDAAFIQTTGTRLARWGGNDRTSYNWKLHLRNTASDWYFENFTDVDSTDWVKWVQDAGSAAIVGIAMVDWTPKEPDTHSFSVAKYGPQQKTDQYRPDAGNGTAPDGKSIQNDPNDAYVPLRDRPSPGDPPGTIYRNGWIEQLKLAFGSHPHLYEFDNEPEIWAFTHRDIHPQPGTYAEMRDKYLEMARLIKSIDPNGKIAGPVVCSWWFYWNSVAGGADKAAHGGVDYLPWWLGQIADADHKNGQRTLDVFDVHAYPDFATNGTPDATDGSRIRSPRGCWDPTFRSEGSIGTKYDATATQPDPNATAIIPRFRAMVSAIYPGTQFAITEWNYGDDNSVASALADADTYGVFGREKVDLATRFTSPKPDTLCALAIQMYKDFGTISVNDRTTVDPNLFTSYAALSADGRQLTVMAINKDPKNSVTARIELIGFQPNNMTAYERSATDTSITALPATAASGTYTFKPYSQTLLAFSGSSATGAVNWSVTPDALMMPTDGQAVLHVQTGEAQGSVKIAGINAQAGVTMTVHQFHLAAGHPATIDVAAGAKPGFYRFTVTGKTSTGHLEAQSGWIVVGVPGSLPVQSHGGSQRRG